MIDDDKNKLARIRALQVAFTGQLPARLATIETQWSVLTDNPTREAAEDLEHLLHSLTGSAATFGYPVLADHAAQIERKVNRAAIHELSEEHGAGIVRRELEVLRDLSRQPPDNVLQEDSVVAHHLPDSHVLFVLEDDPIMGQQIVEQLGRYGFNAEAFENPDDLLARFANYRPAAVVADVIIGDGGLEGMEIASRMQAITDSPVPVVFISIRDDWKARLAAVRAGGQAYLTKPLDYAALAEHLNQFVGTDSDEPYRVIVVDDDLHVAEHHVMLLEGFDIEAWAVIDTSGLLDNMREHRPDLLLMDLHMPDCSGLEVVGLLRQHKEHQHIPIVYLSNERSLGNQLAAMEHGGDGFLTKPVDDRTLFTAVNIRARRFREISKLVSRDSMTGLLNHIAIKLELERELARAERNGEPLCFVMLDLDHFKLINDRFGHSAGDYVIKSLSNLLIRRLRKSDIAGRYGGEEFGIILPKTTASEAAQLINQFRMDFVGIEHTRQGEAFFVAFSAGIAQNSEGSTPNAMINAADKALYTAKAAGRNRVEITQEPVAGRR